ncbi:MAG: HIT domain-containing protein [Candidatus Saccharimonadales bacterium]
MNEIPKPPQDQSDSETESSVFLAHARRADQLAVMEDIASRDICFMCPEHIPEFYEQKDGLIHEGEYSYLVDNGYPYTNTRLHIMAIPKEHIRDLSEISNEFWIEALGYFQQLEQQRGVTGGVVAMRFGNPAETGATARHLHVHFIVPELNADFDEDGPLVFYMSPGPSHTPK